MKLRNTGNKNEGDKETEDKWEPSMEGFLKYLVDTKLIFSTIERILDQSTDVSCLFSC